MEIMKKNDKMFETVFESARDCILIFDKTGYIIDVNQNGCLAWGYSKNEMTGKHVAAFAIPEKKKNTPYQIAKVLKEGYLTFDSEILCKNGNLLPVEINANMAEIDGQEVIVSFHRDISERKKNEKKLIQRREDLQKILDHSPICMGIGKMNGESVYVNDAMCNLLGYTKEEFKTIQAKDIIHPDDQKASSEDFNRLINGEIKIHAQKRYVTKEGKIIWVEGSICVFNDESGEKLHIVQMVDVTERKISEQKLIQNENKFKMIFESAKDIMIMADEDGGIVDVNSTCCELLGYTKEEMIGCHLSKFVAPEFREGVGIRLKKLYKEKSLIFESAHLCKNNTVIPIEVNAHIIEINGKQFKFSINRDITERKAYESTILKNETRYRAVIETFQEGFMMVDRNGKILEVNPAYCKYSGYTEKELLSMSIPDLTVHGSYEKNTAHMKKVIAEGYKKFENQHRRKDGTIWDVETIINFGENNDSVMFGFFIDISQRKKITNMLEHNERKFRMLFENANDFILIAGVDDGKIVDINPLACNRLGYTKEELVGQKLSSIVAPRFSESVEERIKIIKEHGFYIFESAHICKDKSIIPIEVNSRFIEKDGKQMIININRDITMRKEIEDMLKKREAKYRAVIETSQDGFLMVSKEGKILEANDTYIKRSGYTLDELLKLSIFDVTVEGSQEKRAEEMQKLITTGHGRFENYHRKKDGSIYPVETIVNFWNIGEGVLFGFIVDITERKHMLKMLQESEDKFRTLFEYANDFIILLDLNNGCILDINPNSYIRLGYKKEELVGKHISTIVSSKFASKVSNRMSEILKNGFITFESEHLHKDGSVIAVEVSSHLIEKNGKLIDFSIARDITMRKKMEEELLTREALSRAVIERILDS